MDLIPGDAFKFIELIGKVNEFITEFIPWWVILLTGLIVAIFVPILV